MAIRPLGNRILVEPMPQKERSHGGVLLPQQYRDDQMCYRVVEVGTGKKTKTGARLAPDVVPGDFVVAPLYHDHTILTSGQRIIDAGQIIAKWNPQPA